MKIIITRYPVLSFVLLCYLISWSIWYTIPAFVGNNWPLIKIYIGIGLGPGLAAVFLDQYRNKSTKIYKQVWWMSFSLVFLIVAGINLSILLIGDGIDYEDFISSVPPGLSWEGILGTFLAASVVAYIFASAAVSKRPTLNSIVKWQVHWKWWLIAVFLFPAFSVLGYFMEHFISQDMAYFFGNVDETKQVGYGIKSLLFTLFIVGIGEEVGWRGYMLPELQKKFSPLISSIILGLVWGFWHFPMFIIGAYPGEPIDIISYLFIGPILAILFTWLFNNTGGNLLMVIILHAMINNNSKFFITSSVEPILMILVILFIVIKYKMWLKRDPKFVQSKI